MRQMISCGVITFNEEKNIRDCLESAKWMDEIVVVDSFSRDKTVAIAREYTERVYHHPWNGYGEQKNFTIDQTTGGWVFIMDADERVTVELREAIERILEDEELARPVAYYVPRRNFFYGQWIKRAGCYPDYQLRLFRRNAGRMDNAEPHPQFICAGKVAYLTQPLDHYTERTVEDHFRKINSLTNLAARERGKSKSEVHWFDLAFRPLFTFWKYFFVRQGFREGIHGLVFCMFASMYTFVKYAKLWDQIRAQSERSLRPPN
jgi:(heptosyl)LPS beta-1,4-glucosyltransferase